MTFVGHSLVGASIAIWVIPDASRIWKKALMIHLFIIIAYLPDLPFPYWGHFRYHISHSLFVNLGILIPLSLFLLLLRYKEKAITIGMIVGGAAAWLSHLVLDSLYGHGKGIAIFWPFSEAVLNLPIPWFDTLNMKLPLFSGYNLKVFGIEFLCYFPVFLLVLIVRKRASAVRNRD